MKKIILLFFPFFIFSQNINNDLSGYFEIKNGETSFYPSISFDGNGKARITEFSAPEDFFVKNDSVFVFTDKIDVFIFKLKGKELEGLATHFVKGHKWIKNDTLIENNRTDDANAIQQAELLHEYYLKTRKGKDLTFLFDEKEASKYQENLMALCDKGLIRSCKEIFGVKLMNLTGGIGNYILGKELPKITPDAELEALAKKTVAAGDPDGYMLLGSYKEATGEKEEAKKYFDKAVEEGSLKAALLMIEKELELEVKKEEIK